MVPDEDMIVIKPIGIEGAVYVLGEQEVPPAPRPETRDVDLATQVLTVTVEPSTVKDEGRSVHLQEAGVQGQRTKIHLLTRS